MSCMYILLGTYMTHLTLYSKNAFLQSNRLRRRSLLDHLEQGNWKARCDGKMPVL